MNESFKLRFAKYIDKKNIMSFINNHWAENHILSNDDKFFDFQYRLNDNLQFILAIDFDDRIIGLLGFMQYDPPKKPTRCCFSSLESDPKFIRSGFRNKVNRIP